VALSPRPIKVLGAELCSLKNAAGVEFIWQAGPAWPRHAPLLFPIVGRLANDELRHRCKTYRMTERSFARDNRFAWAECGEKSCALTFANEESSPVLRLDGGLLRVATEQSPVKGTLLPLSESLFTDDAIIFDRINGNSVRYAAGQGASTGGLVRNVLARFSRARRLVKTIWRAVPLHRALARLCQSRRFRRRVQRQARFDADRTRCKGNALVPGCGRVRSASLISQHRRLIGPAVRRGFRISRSSSTRFVWR
jgi:hypothetical protein